MRKKMALLFVVLMSLLLTVAGSVAAQDEAGGTYEGTFAVSFPAGWELSEGNDFITLSQGSSVINVYGPDAIANVVVDRMARTPEQLLAFFAERTGYTVGEAIDEMSGAAAAVAVELPRRGLSGFAYLMDIGYQKSAVVYSLSSEAVDLALDEASSAVLDSISYRPTLYEIAAGSEDFSILTAAVDAAGLGAELAGGPYTVFAPSNAAFEAALSALGITAEELLADTETLTSILLYHLVDGTVLSTDLVNGEVATLNGAPVTINLDAGVKVNDATVVAADIVARNGVIHVIDSVLLPPAAEEAEAPAEEAAATPAPTVVDVVAANDVFSTLVAAVTAADLVEAAATLEITVFAPTNKAFADLLDMLGLSAEELLANTELLTAVLTYHVVPGRVFSGDLAAGEVATLQGEPVTISLDGGVFVNDARVLVADIEGSNGVVHMINKVLLPPSVVASLMSVAPPPAEATPTIMGIVRSNPDFSLLNAAIRRAGLSNTLNQAGPLTVFAPNNAAIEATLAELGITADDLLADVAGLTVILRTHIVPGLVTAADVVGLDGQTVETLTGTPGGAPITISVRDGNVFINDTVQVVVTDIMAANGVIHVIDRVIVPPAEEVVEEEPEVVEPATPTIMGIVRSNPDFSLLNAAIRRAGLSNTLNQAGPLTVFAPNNAAIEATLAELGITADDLLADVAGLTVILRTHIVPGLVTAADVVGLDGQTVETLTGTPGGAPITISVRDGNVFINDTVQVVATDIMAANGVIHVIDRVIVPPAEEVVEEEPEVVEPTPAPTIVDVVAGNDVFSTLVAAVTAADLVEAAATLEITVFAPTNKAFEDTLTALGISAEDLLANTELLTAILTYHVVPGRIFSGDLVDGAAVTTLQGEDLAVALGGGVFINDARVLVADIEASNGVVHMINKVLLPPSVEAALFPPAPEPLAEVAMDGTFGSYLGYAFPTAWTQTVGNDFQRYDLEGNALVVFGSTSVSNVVPNLDELEANALLSFFMERSGYEVADLVTLFPADFPGALARVNVELPRRNQVGRAYLAQLSNGDKVVFVALGEGALEPAVNDAAKALGASLVYRPTLTEVAAGNTDLSTLVAAVGASGLGSTLDGGNLTVFAPTNEAFAAALDALGVSAEALLGSGDLLTTILTYHAVPGQVFSTDLVSGEVATVQGDPVTIDLSAGVKVNQANVVVADVVARDAVVHVIDAVLLPPSLCVVSTPATNSTTVRVGPGNNRTPVAFLPTEGLFLVTGQAEANGVTWFRLISTAKAAPGKLINQAWVSSAQVSTSGACDAVPAVEPPPIIPG